MAKEPDLQPRGGWLLQRPISRHYGQGYVGSRDGEAAIYRFLDAKSLPVYLLPAFSSTGADLEVARLYRPHF